MTNTKASNGAKPPPATTTIGSQAATTYNLMSAAGIAATGNVPVSNAVNGAPLKHPMAAAAAMAFAQSGAAALPVAPPVYHPHQPQRIVPLVPLHWQPTPAIQFPPAMSPGPGGYNMGMEGTSETPLVFRNRKLRSGKWTPEEEAYADVLIELFEKGHIDEKNGCTLRSFLSRKLHCAPMRISKKYAGKGIGKMVFLSKTSISAIDGYGSAAYSESIKKLREVETAFIKSCFPEMDLPFPAPGQFMRLPQQAPNGLAPIVPTPVGTAAQTHVAPHMQPAQAAISRTVYSAWPQRVHFAPVQTQQPALKQPVAQQSAPIPAIQGKSNHKVMQNETTTPATQKTVAATNPATRQAESLQQVYLSAANSVMQGSNGAVTAQVPLAPIACPTQTAVASQHAQSLQKVYENSKQPPHTQNSQATARSEDSKLAPRAAATTPNPASTGNSAPRGPERKLPVAAVSNPQPVAGVHKGNPRATASSGGARVPVMPPTATSIPAPVKSHINAAPASAPNLTELPDFLSAFDKVTGRSSGAPAPAPQGASNQYSPTFTTKSFDDLHRFLGKDLSPVTATKSIVNKVSISRGMPVIPMPSPVAKPKQPEPQLTYDNIVKMKHSGQDKTAKEAAKPAQPSYTSMLSEAYSEAITKMKDSEKPGPLGADSYNLFAQQSAFAASQHSAYMISADMPRHRVPPTAVLQQPAASQAGSATQAPAPSNPATHTNVSAHVPARAPTTSAPAAQMQQMEALSAIYQGAFPTPTTNTMPPHRSVIAERPILYPPDQGAVPNSSLRAMPNPNVVSEPSNASDQGTEESEESPTEACNSYTGETTSSDSSNDSSSSNDSDGSNSDTPNYKRSRISYALPGNKRGKRGSYADH